MKRAALWDIYTKKNPKFLTGPVTLTAKGLRKLFDQTWTEGHKQGVQTGRAHAEKGRPQDPMDMLDEVWRRAGARG